MKKSILSLVILAFSITGIMAQNASSYDLGVGLKFRKTEQLYWENGVAADFTSDFLLNKKIHLKMSYVTSRMGSALGTNAIKQDNVELGAAWHFLRCKPLNITAGLNTGFFHANYENPAFNVLPNNSLLLSLEAGLYYRFKFPVTASLTAGYNLINGDGVTGPGTLFPVHYQLSIFYCFKK